MPLAIAVDRGRIEGFCRKWRVKELSIFGSALREDFHPDSDVDVLVELEEDAPWDAFGWVDMIEELEAILGRQVDLVDKAGLRNPFRRHAILRTREVIHAA
ncbi:MAG TPA: nucleotidyltransferase domain-containing protein [Armatimonadota bacterium]|nr:nucleotidyltransferase domain-containing protein [Armatimonadota bacterium]